MAEPYVPILDYTTYNTLLTTLEITTNATSANTTALVAAKASALASKNAVLNLSNANLFFLSGA